jgi:hypothetical protein
MTSAIPPAFQRLLRERANIVLVLADSLFLSERRQIAAYALAAHLPTEPPRQPSGMSKSDPNAVFRLEQEPLI